jgi:hypothetical protein
MFPTEIKDGKVLVHGPGGEVGEATSHDGGGHYIPFRDNIHPRCGGPFVYILHQLDSISPLGYVSNVLPCQMIAHACDGNYKWTNAMCLMKGGER